MIETNERVGSRPSSSGQVSQGLNLTLELEDRSHMPRLLALIQEKDEQTHRALKELHFVHFARFLPLRDQSALLVITEFDGPLDPYVLDFAIAIGDVFDAILGCVRDHPPLPVRDHPQAFIDFVRKNNQVYVAPDTPYSGEYPIYSAYPDKTVIDIIGARTDPAPPPTEAKRVNIDLADVQGNILRGYRASVARHFAVRFGDGAVARRFLQLLVDGDESACPRVTSAAPWGDADRPLYFLNVGVTAQGLQALGVPDALRSRLPRAFVEGPADPERAQLNRDLGASAPADWELGGPSEPVHFLVSLHADDRPDSLEEFDLRSGQLTGWWKRNGGTLVVCHDARALPGEKVHFGYREGMAQPRVAGVQSDTGSDMQPLANVGEFLLGKDYPDIYGGTSLKSMPPQLCQNATFAAVRVLDQDVAAFEKLLDTAALQTGAEREWLAAKLMGRWRDGTPLPAAPTAGCNEFDYAPSHRYPQLPNDHEGLVCPVGSHIRRMNPRSALVAGRPHSRRLIRRGMPYGPVFDPRNPDRERRGLYGIFICADLERQFEFLLQEWANRDSSASGIRGTQDPIIGAQDLGGEFLIPVAGRDGPFKLKVPRLVTTRGSLYLLLPSIEGLRFLARGEGFTSSAVSSAQSIVPQRRNERKGAGFDPKAFDPKDPRFLADPYPYYAWFRQHAPVARVTHGGYESFWVFSHELVTAACDATDLFLKQPANEKDVRGLFFMDPPRHTEVRGVIEPLFEQAIADTSATAREQADAAIDEIRAGESVFDLICSYSNRVTRNVFMEMFGLPPADWDMLGALVHTVLNHSDQMLPDGERAPAGAAGASLGAYFHEAGMRCPAAAASAQLLCRMAQAARQGRLQDAEVTLSAVHFALGGYLSTDFLAGTALHNLLSRPQALAAFRAGDAGWRSRAIEELKRFDAPFQMADRFAARETELGGCTICAGSRVTLVYGSANRDERIFGETADRLDLERSIEPASNYVFGHGIHRCIGAPMVEQVAPIAIGRLLDAMPGLALADVSPTRYQDPYYRAFSSLALHH